MKKNFVIIILIIINLNLYSGVKFKSISKIEDLHIMNEEKEIESIIFRNSIDLSKLSVEERKNAFISMILPSILILNNEIIENRIILEKEIKKKKLSYFEKETLKKLKNEYRIDDSKQLMRQYDVIPVEIVLSQAIVESGWGQSRFFLSANNIFGIWSFSKKDKKIKALEKRGNKEIFVKSYDSIYDSLKDYYRTLNTGSAYTEFRKLRNNKILGEKLVETLILYSELGEAYIIKLKSIIDYNDLSKYSEYKLK